MVPADHTLALADDQESPGVHVCANPKCRINALNHIPWEMVLIDKGSLPLSIDDLEILGI